MLMWHNHLQLILQVKCGDISISFTIKMLTCGKVQIEKMASHVSMATILPRLA
jgi:hypothetical protein